MIIDSFWLNGMGKNCVRRRGLSDITKLCGSVRVKTYDLIYSTRIPLYGSWIQFTIWVDGFSWLFKFILRFFTFIVVDEAINEGEFGWSGNSKRRWPWHFIASKFFEHTQSAYYLNDYYLLHSLHIGHFHRLVWWLLSVHGKRVLSLRNDTALCRPVCATLRSIAMTQEPCPILTIIIHALTRH